jgi:hypothetical protein
MFVKWIAAEPGADETIDQSERSAVPFALPIEFSLEPITR